MIMPPAQSAQIQATLTLIPGPLTMAVNGSVVTVADATGSGDGWSVQATAHGGTAVLEGFTASCGQDSTCSLPVSPLAYPLPVDGPTAVLLALPWSGMGMVVYHLDWMTSSDGSGPVTVTMAVSSGP